MHMCIMDYYLAFIIKEKSVICNNMDASGKQYDVWDKSGKEQQILHDLPHMGTLKNIKFLKAEARGCLGGVGVEEEWRRVSRRCNVSLRQKK